MQAKYDCDNCRYKIDKSFCNYCNNCEQHSNFVPVINLPDILKEIQARMDTYNELPGTDKLKLGIIYAGQVSGFDIPYLLAALQKSNRICYTYKENSGKLFERVQKLEAALQEAQDSNNKLAEKIQHQQRYNECQHKENKLLKQDIQQAEAREQGLRAKLINAKSRADDCVTKVRHGLGAGGHGSGMYMEIATGNVVLDAVQDYIDEAFEQR
jgi:hypothetical protein